MNEHPIKNLIDASMGKIKEMVDGDTVVGKPITMGDDCVIIPVSQVSIGFASGGSDLPVKAQPKDFFGGGSDLPVKAQPKDFFGGGSGAGLKVVPVGFLVVNKGEVRLLEFTKKTDTTADRVVGMVPDVMDKITGLVSDMQKKKENTAEKEA